jgi:hypothetical protein
MSRFQSPMGHNKRGPCSAPARACTLPHPHPLPNKPTHNDAQPAAWGALARAIIDVALCSWAACAPMRRCPPQHCARAQRRPLAAAPCAARFDWAACNARRAHPSPPLPFFPPLHSRVKTFRPLPCLLGHRADSGHAGSRWAADDSLRRRRSATRTTWATTWTNQLRIPGCFVPLIRRKDGRTLHSEITTFSRSPRTPHLIRLLVPH